ncbi:F-actin-capping protein subunit beta [Tritrichomonas foetus]|uniref:F-actin-capping protein subunit beta n=1 Tax=Tritrichomonas foetus TaxID=1144522 RepID=A0A1J4KF90_9EUKA|nr:F-actin-capping protein subunit beta [Tritrichomonas foetus]|eukprot:OHT09600.1 F-actin-capping protein subunit beta [Tritrichomonas foetus]
MSYSDPSEAAYDLLRHVPPKDIEPRMYDVIRLNEDLTEDILSTTDIPLQTAIDPTNSQHYIKCDYNRDGDSYRSPYSNKYYPPLDDGLEIPDELRKIEQLAQTGFRTYLRQYFGSGVLSVYCWPVDDRIFGVGVFVKKELEDRLRDSTPVRGSINCTDVIEVSSIGKNRFKYTLVSSILLELEVDTNMGEPLKLSGGCSDRREQTGNAASPKEHLVTVGTMIEDCTSSFMEKVRQIYVGKMKEILSYTKGSAAGATAQDLMRMAFHEAQKQ